MSNVSILCYVNDKYPVPGTTFPVHTPDVWPVVFPRCYKVMVNGVTVCDIRPEPGDRRYATLADHPVVAGLLALER